MGLGAYQNAIEGTLRQIRRSLTIVNNIALKGVAIYSMGAHNAPVDGNPYAQPTKRDTPYRSFDDLASGLKTGKTVAGQPLEPRAGVGVYATSVSALPLAWKATPATGHLKGIVRHSDGSPVDTADISIDGISASRAGKIAAATASATTTTDGNGFYAHIDLAPGSYHVTVLPPGDGRYVSACIIDVAAGSIATLDLTIDSGHPSIATCANESQSSATSRLRYPR